MSLVVVMVFALGVLALTGIGPLRRLRVQALQKLRRMTLAYGVVAVPMNLLTPSVKERPSGTGPFTILSLVTLVLARTRQPATRSSGRRHAIRIPSSASSCELGGELTAADEVELAEDVRQMGFWTVRRDTYRRAPTSGLASPFATCSLTATPSASTTPSRTSGARVATSSSTHRGREHGLDALDVGRRSG